MKKQTILIVIVIVCFTQVAISQVSNGTNTFGGSNEYVGWNTTPGSPDLNIKHELDQPIRFYTDAANGTGLFNNQRMIIDKTPGHVGIGLNFAPGNDVLDILPDVNFPRTGYGINHQTVLQNYGANNICVGVGAGQSNTTGSNNTFMGTLSGSSNAVGSSNTFIGTQAGSGAEQVNNAVAIGCKAEVKCSDCTVIGGKYVGINTTTPQTTLEVNGTITTKQLLIANENQKQDVTAMLNELKNEIAQLKEQLNQITKN